MIECFSWFNMSETPPVLRAATLLTWSLSVLSLISIVEIILSDG